MAKSKEVKAKKAPKVEKKTTKEVPVKKPTVKKVVIVEEVVPAIEPPIETPIVEEVDSVLESIDELKDDGPEVEIALTEKTPQVMMSEADKAENKRMQKYAQLGGLQYYLDHVKGK